MCAKLSQQHQLKPKTGCTVERTMELNWSRYIQLPQRDIEIASNSGDTPQNIQNERQKMAKQAINARQPFQRHRSNHETLLHLTEFQLFRFRSIFVPSQTHTHIAFQANPNRGMESSEMMHHSSYETETADETLFLARKN